MTTSASLSVIAQPGGGRGAERPVAWLIRAGKQEWEATFDAISDPIAVFDRQAGCCAATRRWPRICGVTALRGLTCDEIVLGGPFPACAVAAAAVATARHAEVSAARAHLQRDDLPGAPRSDGAAIVQIAKDVTHEIQTARRLGR